MLDTLEKRKNREYSDIVLLYIHGWNITEICKEMKLSRFKVKKQLVYSLSFLKKLLKNDRTLK